MNKTYEMFSRYMLLRLRISRQQRQQKPKNVSEITKTSKPRGKAGQNILSWKQ
jgi:hypothetical protein